MANWFLRIFGMGGDGQNSSTPVLTKDRAAESMINSLESLNETEESLEKKRALLEKRIKDELEKAKALNAQAKKKEALLALKKKKMLESQIEQTDNLILRISEQRIMLENQRTTAEAVSTMVGAADAAKQTMAEMNIDNVDKLMDEINEGNNMMAAVNDALGQGFDLGINLDEDELDEELKQLEAEANGVGMDVPETPLPSVPTTVVAPKAKAKAQAEEELAALEAEFAS
ncbi:unnamed protein product [Ostreobium quekettii]|uniref:Uncharacterized protein n=1 Tax=Ostreobium quekettii TaxID=121088 RepID=A0A8S1IU95_9CHLO|nr:unnamed protein product [Ostreobium quekettii]|eukprot:evm.model.scf_1.10 EVM.evm.TU.scf_1.10   scf_1:229368-231688(+)